MQGPTTTPISLMLSPPSSPPSPPSSSLQEPLLLASQPL
jgi:hypothetical protein